jgi:hypothetical protein
LKISNEKAQERTPAPDGQAKNRAASKVPGGNQDYEPNSKIDPAEVWYERQKGAANDTSSHPERRAGRPIYITDSSGKIIKTVYPGIGKKIDTINH